MKYILAVSGGVDSVALLDMAVKKMVNASMDDAKFVVAHFDHGIRPESDWDARFVWELAKKYGLPCEVRREDLGKNASEALARARRYKFLRDMATKYDATIITAHHQDDLIETIAINLKRGTGWRGLAVFGSRDIERPLLSKTKQELYQYALENNLEWLEDETNISDNYLRNQLRRKSHTALTPAVRNTVLQLWEKQTSLRREIEQEIAEKLPNSPFSRYFFIMAPQEVALELLSKTAGGKLTRPQLLAALLAIKTFRPSQKFEAGNGIEFEFGPRYFTMKDTSRLL